MVASPPIERTPTKPFELPPKNDNMRRVYAYLLNKRGIDRDVLYAFAHAGMIYESADYHNAIFVGFDNNGKPMHAHKRGTGSESSYNFSTAELTTKGYEKYSSLDSLGRCGVAIASCGKEIMPGANEERGSISSIKPTGWVQKSYSGVSGGYLWNRCHLIGWQLSAENANRQNLITGTRYMNINGMLPFENMVADYIRETGNHVAYRITPPFL